MTAAEKQAQAVERLLADPTREIKLPAGPKEKTLRAPREMMKNVSGSSAGAGSGEFHVYKHARRREYERVKMMEEQAQKVRRRGGGDDAGNGGGSGGGGGVCECMFVRTKNC